MTKIEWTQRPGTKGVTWNPIRARNKATAKVGWHCEHVTEACRFCYAEARNKNTFFGNGLEYKPGHRNAHGVEVFLDEETLLAPLRWKAPRTIFVCSMTDLFGEWVSDEWLDRIYAVMALTPQHTWIVLTKRPERMRTFSLRVRSNAHHPAMDCAAVMAATGRWNTPPLNLSAWPLSNVWHGVSVCDQGDADEAIPPLLETPSAIRFVSYEPALGAVDFTCRPLVDRAGWWNFLTGEKHVQPVHASPMKTAALHWIISGGESGPKARPSHPDWHRSVRDQCAAAGVPYFFKQWGEWAPGENCGGPPTRTERTADWFNEQWSFSMLTPRMSGETHREDAPDVYRVGKKRAGRLLDGGEHSAFPERAA